MNVDWEKIDKFFLVLTLTLVVLSTILVLSFRGVFSLLLTAYDFDPNDLPSNVSVDKGKLNEASNFVYNKSVVKLNPLP